MTPDGTSAYGVAHFVRDLRAVTAAESDPAKITERVGPLARRLALAKDRWLESSIPSGRSRSRSR